MSETSTLISHSGRVTRAELAELPTPPATPTHMPIPHIELVETLVGTLSLRHIGVVGEEFAVSSDGMEMFGVLDLETIFASGLWSHFIIGRRIHAFHGFEKSNAEIKTPKSDTHTFPGRFHQTVRMPLEESYLAVHGSEDKRHGLRPSQRFVFLPDLIEVHLPGAPSLVKIGDAGTVELGFSLSQDHKICSG